jgi:hypothetical protein
LDKPQAIGEMVRVARPGGYIGISDLYWKDDAPQGVKSRLAELEGEQPENLSGWIRLFEQVGLQDVHTEDRSEALARMAKETRKQLGVLGYMKIVLRVLRRWGVGGVARVMEADKVFRSKYLGYAIIVRRKRQAVNLAVRYRPGCLVGRCGAAVVVGTSDLRTGSRISTGAARLGHPLRGTHKKTTEKDEQE